jgi:hypothetical protein
MYMQVKERTTSILPRQIASAPFAAADALARLMLDASPYARMRAQQAEVAPPYSPSDFSPGPMPPPVEPVPPAPETNVSLQVQQLRNEIEALRASLGSGSVAVAPPAVVATARKKARSAKKKRS